MIKLVTLSFGLVTLGALVLPASFKNNQTVKNNDGVLINSEKQVGGPVFYPASYSTSYSDEPYFSTQNSLTFSKMNYSNTKDHYRGDSVKVAVIDSGIRYTHEDFGTINGSSRSIEYNSGWYYYEYSNNPSHLNDSLGHGTNVASVIASAINQIGCAGIAPNVDLYVYKVTTSDNGYNFNAINNALQYCIDNHMDIINMSFQSYEHAVTYNGSTMAASSGCSTALSTKLNACHNAGITLVAAAGNYDTSEPSYPASNNHVISVGSLAKGSTTTKAGYSNTYGIDVVAPGSVYVADNTSNSAYKETQGTSFSAPIVTAALALYKERHPNATSSEIEAALYASCDSISGNPSWAGNGRLNIDKLLDCEQDNVPVDIILNNPEIQNDELNLTIGDKFDLDWTVDGNGTYSDEITFTLYGETGAISVDQNGHIEALAEGYDIIEIASVQDSSISVVLQVNVAAPVEPATVSSVAVSHSNLNLDLNGTKTYTLTASVNGTNNPPQTVTWTSSNTSVATVSSSGLVTAKSVGSAIITATSTYDNTKSDTCSVTVSDSTVHVTGVSLNKSSTSISEGGSETLTATIEPSNATNKNVSWTSSNTSVATVSSSGVVTAVKAGSTTITVTTVDGSFTDTCTVTVNESLSRKFTIGWGNATGSEGTYQNFSATSGTVTDILSFSSLQNSGTNPPAVSSSELRLYYNSSGNGCSVTLTPVSGVTIAKAVIKTSTSPSVKYKVNGGTAVSVSASSNTYTIDGINATQSLFIQNANTSNTQLRISTIEITYTIVALTSISINTDNVTKSFETGDSFSYTGLVTTAHYSDSSSKTVTPTSVSSPNMNTAGNKTVTVSYTEKGITKTATYEITVTEARALLSISISGQTTSFTEGDTFAFGGTVTAHFNDSSSENVTTSATYTGYDMTAVGNHTVTVSYTYKGTTKTTTYQITVNAGTLSSIAVSGQTTVYVRNVAFSFDGTCTAAFANGYQKSVTPTSISSPDMSSAGVKTINVSYTYNGKTVETSYSITVNAYREVLEEAYSVVGNITYPSNTETISVNTLSATTSGYTNIESNSIRLGSGGSTGTVTVTSTTTNIYKIVVRAKRYGSDSSVNLSIGGTNNTISGSYADYTKEYSTPVKTVAIATTANSKRAYVESITVYTKINQDIGQGEACQGLETFISNYLHMDYTESLGYCKDSEHHYYSTAKAAFNALNADQRRIFTSNSAYSAEWNRLSTWASFNGETLNNNNLLATADVANLGFEIDSSNNISLIIALLSISSLLVIGVFVIYRKKQK